jgi:SAM-dependent methyltransferase
MRPFYSEFAWAYTLLVDAPVPARCDFIQACLTEAGAPPGSHLLDAGCRPGHYSLELARRDYRVTGMGASPALLAEARRAASGLPPSVELLDGDMTRLPSSLHVDGILCRGVLNDQVDDDARQQVFPAFARTLRPGGALLFDVRDWQATAARKTREPVTERTDQTERGTLTFRSTTHLDEPSHRLLISERHTLTNETGTRDADHEFVVRCWTEDEVRERLRDADLTPLRWYGGFNADVPLGATDRIVCLARR